MGTASLTDKGSFQRFFRVGKVESDTSRRDFDLCKIGNMISKGKLDFGIYSEKY